MKRLLLPALLAAAAGCVTSSSFKAEESRAHDAQALTASLSKDLDASRAQAGALQKDLEGTKVQVATLSKSESDLKAGLGETQAKLASAYDQVAALQKSNQDLQGSLEANKGELTKKVSELVKEKDALGQRLAQQESSAAEARAAKERELADLGRRAADLEAKGTDLSAKLQDAGDRLQALEKAKAALESEKAALQRQKDDEVSAVKKSYEGLAAGLKAEISAGEVTISSLKGKLTVNLVDRILFDSGSAEVKPAGKKVLARVGALLNDVKDKDIRIEGHTDNVPLKEELRERWPSNWELSTARATSVARYLEDHAKVDPHRLVAAGMGEWRPVAANDKPEGRAQNRRIEIILVPRD